MRSTMRSTMPSYVFPTSPAQYASFWVTLPLRMFADECAIASAFMEQFGPPEPEKAPAATGKGPVVIGLR